MTANLPLNRRQAEELFERYSVLVQDRDVMPVINAVDLLGKENIRAAVAFCNESNPRIHGVQMYGACGFQLHYISIKVFLIAATIANVQFFGETLEDRIID